MLIDLHTHTSFGSPCSYMEPASLIRRAKEVGLDGVCITEHNVIWSEEEIRRLQDKHGFLIIGGVEVNTDCGEVLVYGLHESALGISRIVDLRALVDRVGGVIVVAHPFRSDAELPRKDDPNLAKALEVVVERQVFGCVDGIEVFNGRSSKWERDFAAKVAAHLNLGGTGGSDAHAVGGVGSCFTVFDCEIRGEEDLIRAIKQGRFKGRERFATDW